MKIIRKVPLPANHKNAKKMVKSLQTDFPGIKYGDACPCGECEERLFAYEISDEDLELILSGRARVEPILGH